MATRTAEECLKKVSGEKTQQHKKIAIRPTHKKIKAKAISQPTSLDGQPTFKANGT
jgi:hypothetical protein